MQILSKAERKMTLEEKLKLDFVRTWSIARDGSNFRDPNKNFVLTHDSQTFRILNLVLTKFNISYKDPSDAKDFFPENETTYPEKSNYHVVMENWHRKQEAQKALIMREQNAKLSLISGMKGYLKSEKQKEKLNADKSETENQPEVKEAVEEIKQETTEVKKSSEDKKNTQVTNKNSGKKKKAENKK